ncbi:exported hypothetical protein [Candidatus Sulfotelmatobacter kueseliae]|uniref:Uncharacterized protein n=1 Tax=Candidatus Sulfotelmatobacter kueseliae TaxID=2042962 RepID=A0A2U3KHE9_9BACT|nr:exported hypothetical protein [Candidatus Sulfotelmatobacter kueseliae]
MREQVARPNSCPGQALLALPPGRRSIKGTGMRRFVSLGFFVALAFAGAAGSAQSDYRVIAVVDRGTVSGTVKWSGPVPRSLVFPITKDPDVCDPDSKKTAELDLLIIGPRLAWPIPLSTSITSPPAKPWTCPSSGVTLISSIAAMSRTFFWFRRTRPSPWSVPTLPCTPFTWMARPPLICPFLSPAGLLRVSCPPPAWSTCAATAATSG